MNLSHYGQIVHSNFKGKEEGETYSSIVRRLKDRLRGINGIDQARELTRGRIIEKLAQSSLPMETLGQISAWVLTRKRRRSPDKKEERPKKKARFTKELPQGEKNRLRSHYCQRCSDTASHFDRERVSVRLPFEHAYGRCPLYCHDCSREGSRACQNPEEHLKFSCLLCDTELSNHPTEKCRYTRLYD